MKKIQLEHSFRKDRTRMNHLMDRFVHCRFWLFATYFEIAFFFFTSKIINVEYQADEQGFRVHGGEFIAGIKKIFPIHLTNFFCLLDHLPTPPPVGPEIQKGLDLIYEGIRLQAERRKNNPNYAVDNAERERLNYLGLYIGN